MLFNKTYFGVSDGDGYDGYDGTTGDGYDGIRRGRRNVYIYIYIYMFVCVYIFFIGGAFGGAI